MVAIEKSASSKKKCKSSDHLRNSLFQDIRIGKTLSKSKNSQPASADAEGVSPPSRSEIIAGLNEDLAREYKSIIQYAVFSSTLKGPEYGDIAEQLKKHASQELAHALEVARQIDYLGGDPTVKSKDAEFSDDSKKMLEIDLRAEQETIKNYRERIIQAERGGEFALSEKLRGIIAQEQDHEIDLKDALGLR
ncbi:bacterioferritin (cytochrome b1) [Candidatus Nitrososphaera evergladensis SR1]|jgi:bacterioferritin|uniref:Bacterioferritin (Cytochrome b1) n=1 Tax=Candidatus Nitrososphaera evergladensis SR1 TaxID=1459636 RepID=A0A075MU64_9ARCH|nr:ferritin-like domain-containing protein [Candidatus Nitrososphaera evergladensis]AIF84257.1 bacterioferritin (cytochrome b1) [Candidatus Nitrososphaera evergladensis SR1]